MNVNSLSYNFDLLNNQIGFYPSKLTITMLNNNDKQVVLNLKVSTREYIFFLDQSYYYLLIPIQLY